jgi:Putative zinc ribbon domain
MPLSKDPEGGGTEADGSRSHRYCSHCYRSGHFTLPDITVDQMREVVIAKLTTLHFPLPLARLMTRNLAKLERWRSRQDA